MIGRTVGKGRGRTCDDHLWTEYVIITRFISLVYIFLLALIPGEAGGLGKLE